MSLRFHGVILSEIAQKDARFESKDLLFSAISIETSSYVSPYFAAVGAACTFTVTSFDLIDPDVAESF